MPGRPFRFLAMVLAGWIGWRIFMLWPGAVIASAPFAESIVAPIDDGSTLNWLSRAQAATLTPGAIRIAPDIGPAALPPVLSIHRADTARIGFAVANLASFGGRFAPGDATIHPAALYREGEGPQRWPMATSPAKPDRWRASAWLVTRGGPATGSGQLGASQMGLALHHGIVPGWSGYARATAPFEGSGKEFVIGIDWQLPEMPVRMIAERRFGIDGQAGGPAIGLVAGVASRSAASLEVEAYGQVGMIWRDKAEGYGDGFLRVAQPVLDISPGQLDLGLGAWAAAQRDAHRIDIGPSVGARIPAGNRTLRASIDWRERVTGDARPGSGPALTLAADF